MAKIPHSQCREPRFNPWPENEIPHSTTMGLCTSQRIKDPASCAWDSAQPNKRIHFTAVPPSVKQPTITAIEVSDGEVWLAVTDTVPYLSYAIISGDTPTALKTDYFSEVIDGDNGSEIAIGTVQSPTRRFFKVKRAE